MSILKIRIKTIQKIHLMSKLKRGKIQNLKNIFFKQNNQSFFSYEIKLKESINLV